MEAFGGAYTADRAAALSGVPRSTIYYWARKGHLVPSVSQSQTKLWSYQDLLGLRVLYWLRQPKKAFDREVPSTSMSKVRHALQELDRIGIELLEGGRPVVCVTLDGDIAFDSDAAPLQLVNGQYLHRGAINLVGVFEGLEGATGPDLVAPRPTLRILPRKLGGAPHLVGTRLPTLPLHTLAERGLSIHQIGRLYPFASREALQDGIDLEKQLARNLEVRRAA